MTTGTSMEHEMGLKYNFSHLTTQYMYILVVLHSQINLPTNYFSINNNNNNSNMYL